MALVPGGDVWCASCALELRKQSSSSSPPAGHSSPFCTAMLPVALSPFQNICFVMEQRFCSGMVLSGEQGLDGLSTAVHW